jgi:Na+-driven multidrug efflux pump
MATGANTINMAQLTEGRYLGMVSTDALAAMGFAFPSPLPLFAFAGGIGSGASSVIARTLGAGNQERVTALVFHAPLLAIVVGALLGLLAALFADDIVRGLGAKDQWPPVRSYKSC